MKPIGVIHTPFRHSEGTPIQTAFAEGKEGTAVLKPEYAEGLKDLEGFERIWLIYWFDRAAGACKLVVTPYLGDAPHGVFATRAPARPNPIGMSPVRLLAVEGNVLHLADVDILDGTPLLDVKPYVSRFDCFRTTRNGWVDAAGDRRVVADNRFAHGADAEN
ncbi:MAG: tRNA (N6-threonylcarbamoyladenosine(37)-N6)-methyltransferase TrmO [Bryobacterales bacterium]|nr:tRNA (N6-threonylcarbamoyladenosine(37)-N6)-methyltransferase TrmO [Bryobacterales bacterium]